MNKQLTSDERAVSELVGEVLLMGIVVVAIGLIAVSVYSYLNNDPETPHIEVDGITNIGKNEIHIKHQGGDPIECENLRVLVSVNGTALDPFDDTSPLRWGLREKGIGNFDRWTLGNILVLDTMPEVNITEDDTIRVTLVSLSSNRVIMSGEVFGGLFGNASINRIPIADAGDDRINGLCGDNATLTNISVWFDGSGSYDPDNPHGGIYRGIVSWDWEFEEANGTTTTDHGIWVQHTYNDSGIYDVTLTVTDVDGATAEDTCKITIRPPEPLSADAGPDQWAAIGADVQFDGSGSTGCIKEWQWEFGDGNITTTNTSAITHAYSEEGEYTINLTVVEDHTGKMANDSCNIIVVVNGFKIVRPADGAWASGIELIEVYVLGMEGSDHTDFSIRSVSSETNYSLDVTDDSGETVTQNTTSYTHNWNTASLECGNYTIHATAYNAGGTEMGTDNITVCVCDLLDLVGFWRFDDGTGSRAANDSSCNRNHGIINGDPTWITDGIWHALRFNGSEYIEVANSTSLAMTNKTTIGVWANSSDAGEQYILAKGDVVFELNITTTYTDRISMPDPDNFKFLVYHGNLNSTDLDINWTESGLELVMVNDSNETEIRVVQEAGVKVYYYIALGRSYNESTSKTDWEAGVLDEMDAHNYTDGFVWDELDDEYYGDEANRLDFNERLDRLNDHAHNNMTGKKTVANGVRYYANHNGSDYYLWESFISTHYSGAYHYDDFFNGTAPSGDLWSDNSTDRINGIKKYDYLNASGVLNRTLAHCYGPANDDNRSIYGYIASRVLGLKGFSYADSTNFVSENATIAEGLKWDLGTRMNYSVDADAGNLSGRFTNGAVVDCVNQTVAFDNTTYTTDLISDPLTAHLLNNSSRVTGLDLCLIRGQVDFMHGVLRSSTDITGWDSWHHNATAAVILDAEKGTSTLRVDDVLAANRTFPMGLPFDFTGSNLTIGANNTGTYGFNGSIEEVRIYDS